VNKAKKLPLFTVDESLRESECYLFKNIYDSFTPLLRTSKHMPIPPPI